MKIFQVVLRGSQWHVHRPDAGRGVNGSEDKDRIVEWARDEARRHDGEVRVMDRGGALAAVYSYKDGEEHHRIVRP